MHLGPTSNRTAGFSLMESMIAITLLAIVASSTVYAMVSSNRFAISQRYVSNAKALCQERIDEALSSTFPPPTNDTLFGNWGASIKDQEALTATEAKPIYTMLDAGQAAPPLVTGTRQTWVTRFAPDGADPAFVYARVRVRVEFWLQEKAGDATSGRGINNRLKSQGGSPFFYEMITLRAPD